MRRYDLWLAHGKLHVLDGLPDRHRALVHGPGVRSLCSTPDMLLCENEPTNAFHSMGDPPYDQVITFGTAIYDQNAITCGALGGRQVCIQVGGTVVLAPITRTSAKL